MAGPISRLDDGRMPGWAWLALLTAVVLAIHLWMIGVAPPGFDGGHGEPRPASGLEGMPVALASETHPAARKTAAAPVSGSVDVMRVRWLPAEPSPDSAPKPHPLTQPARKAAPPAPAHPVPPTAGPDTDEAAEAMEPPVPAMPDAELLAQATAGGAAPAPDMPSSAAGSGGVLPPSQPPGSTRLDYHIDGNIKGLNYRATGTLAWTLEAGRYAARTEMTLFMVGSRVQTSVGSVGPEGLRPERFSDKRRSEVATHFERASGRIRFSGNAPEAALMPAAQDRLSLFMQLAGLLQARPYREGDVIAFQVAGTGDAEPWRFEVGDLQALDLPAGKVTARWIRRLPRKPHDSMVEMWLAPSMGHLPVRLRISQANGDVADQRLARLP